MDEVVKQAMAKWPNVPHCYGWLALDARGGWRMRDERSQALNLPGDKINNAALLGFINRNYTHDDQGRWYFQNGPQRVYINLEVTPYIARTDPREGFILQTGETLGAIDGAWITEAGQLLLKSGDRIAAVDDRDMAQCLPLLRMEDKPVEDEHLLAWLADASRNDGLVLQLEDRHIPVEKISAQSIADRFGFVQAPQATS